MTVKHIEEYHCDRCKQVYNHRSENSYQDIITMAIGWFTFRNGSGSKTSPAVHRTWENLDNDLCDVCTAEFLTWWEKV